MTTTWVTSDLRLGVKLQQQHNKHTCGGRQLGKDYKPLVATGGGFKLCTADRVALCMSLPAP